MTLARCFDAAYPPDQPPAGAQAVLGYISAGGLDRNYHTWTPAEWAPFAHLRQFPVVELNPATNARASAQAAVARMRDLGWRPGRALVGALETFIVPAWWAVFEDEADLLGAWTVGYGSESTIYQNNCKRVWQALFNGVPTLPPNRPTCVGNQYLSGGSLDWSVLSTLLMDRGGEGIRNQNA